MSPKSGALAAALVAALQLAAVAQVDVAWNSFPETRRAPVFYRPGDPLPEFTPSFRPLRPDLEVIETPEDRELRMQAISMCTLLGPVRGRTILDVVAGAPNTVMDLASSVLQPAPDRSESRPLVGGGGGMVISRAFSYSLQDASSHPFDDLVGHLVVREQKYFARFQDSSLATPGLEDGTEDLDMDSFMADQRKLMFDAARKLYFGRMGSGVDDRLRDESLDVARWHPVDYVVAPALIGGYLFVRGWEKKVDVFGLKCGLQVEPIRRILERFEGSHNDLVSAVSLELGRPEFPVKFIVSFGIQDGQGLVDFVGIGTSVGKAKQIVEQELLGLKDD